MIIRTYGCADCNYQWEVTVEDPDAPDPECPECSKVLQWIPSKLNIGTVKGRAIDVAQQVMEQDYGLSNWNDGNREGDIAYKPPAPAHTAEREDIEREVREYVAQTTRNIPMPLENAPTGIMAQPSHAMQIQTQPMATSVALAGCKQGPEQGVNPMEILHQGIKAGHVRTPVRIMSRWKP